MGASSASFFNFMSLTDRSGKQRTLRGTTIAVSVCGKAPAIRRTFILFAPEASRVPYEPFQPICRAAGAAAILIGALVLLGWAFDISLLKSVLRGKIAMKPNTARPFFLTGSRNGARS